MAGPASNVDTSELRSSLILDKETYKILCPVGGGGIYSLSNCIPSIVGHTQEGYAFKFENGSNRQALFTPF